MLSSLSPGKYEDDSEDMDSKSSKSGSKETSLHSQLSRYLLKSLASEVTNSLFNLAAADVLMKVKKNAQWFETVFLKSTH